MYLTNTQSLFASIFLASIANARVSTEMLAFLLTYSVNTSTNAARPPSGVVLFPATSITVTVTVPAEANFGQ